MHFFFSLLCIPIVLVERENSHFFHSPRFWVVMQRKELFKILCGMWNPHCGCAWISIHWPRFDFGNACVFIFRNPIEYDLFFKNMSHFGWFLPVGHIHSGPFRATVVFSRSRRVIAELDKHDQRKKKNKQRKKETIARFYLLRLEFLSIHR